MEDEDRGTIDLKLMTRHVSDQWFESPHGTMDLDLASESISEALTLNQRAGEKMVVGRRPKDTWIEGLGFSHSNNTIDAAVDPTSAGDC